MPRLHKMPYTKPIPPDAKRVTHKGVVGCGVRRKLGGKRQGQEWRPGQDPEQVPLPRAVVLAARAHPGPLYLVPYRLYVRHG